MASKYKRHSTGGRFKQRGASDLGSGAIKTQADIVIDSLKLQRARTSEYASDYVQGMKGVENTEEWNQNLLNDLEDKAYQTRREAIKVRQKREVESLEGKAKEYGKQAEYWKDFSTTYSEQWGKLAQGVTDLGLRKAADEELERLKENKIFTLENLEALVDEGMSSEFDANHKDPKALNTLTKLFNSRNHHLRKGILRELNVQLPSIFLELEEKIQEDPELQWTPATIQEHFNTLGKGLVRKFDLGNTREGKSLLATFNKNGYLKATYNQNMIDVAEDEKTVTIAAESLIANKDSDVYYATDDLGLDYDDPDADPTVRGGGKIDQLVLKQNFLSAISSQKRKVGDKFVIGYSDPREAIAAAGQKIAPFIPDPNEFVDFMTDFPTPGNSKQTFGQRNKEPAALAKLQKDFTDIHQAFWEKERKDKAAAHEVKDLANREIVRERIGTLDFGNKDDMKALSDMKLEFAGYPKTVETISKALLFNFPSKNGILINDDLIKASNEADLKRMDSIYPYLPKSLQEAWKEARSEIELQKTVTSSEGLRTRAKRKIKEIENDESLNPKSSNTSGDPDTGAVEAWLQTYQLNWRSTKGKGLSAEARDQAAVDAADLAADSGAGLFRRRKNSYGNIEWLAFKKETLTDEGKTNEFASGMSKKQLTDYLNKNGANGLLNDERVGKRDEQGEAVDGGFNPMPLDYYDEVAQAQAANKDIRIHDNLELIYRSQTGPYRMTRTELLNHFMNAGHKKPSPVQLSLSNLPPGMTDKIQYDIESSKMNFPNYHWYPVGDQIATGVLANLLKDPESKVQDYYDKDLIEAMSSAELSGIDPIDYINQPKYDPFKIFSNVIRGK